MIGEYKLDRSLKVFGLQMRSTDKHGKMKEPQQSSSHSNLQFGGKRRENRERQAEINENKKVPADR